MEAILAIILNVILQYKVLTILMQSIISTNILHFFYKNKKEHSSTRKIAKCSRKGH